MKFAKHVVSFVVVLAITSLFVPPLVKAADDGGPLPYVVTVAPDRWEAVYDLDDTVAFVVRVSQGGKPANDVLVYWELTNEGLQLVNVGSSRTERGVVRVSGGLDEPGFLRFQATVDSAGGTVTETVAVVIGPDDIVPGLPAPADFDAFWDDQKAALAAVLPTATQRAVNSGNANIEAWDVQVDSLGEPVSGYLARPKGAELRSLPAIITLHGSGVRGASLGTATGWAANGMLAMDINAHGIANGQPADYYTQLSQTSLYDYRSVGRESRESFYFLGMFLRVIRAIDFITAQLEWDGKTVILYGTSQGGAQALAGAGLDERVTFIVAGVPSMANLGGIVRDQPMRWNLRQVSVQQADRMKDTLQYFDTANFAARAKADAFFTVAFLDNVVHSSTVYAAYNALPNGKNIYNDVAAGHENTPEATRRMREAVSQHVADMK